MAAFPSSNGPLGNCRERYFFNGLTEEIVKKAKGTTTDNSFHSNLKLDGEWQSTSGWTYSSYITFEDNTARRQKAYKIAYQCKHGQARWDTGNGWNESGYRTFSAWVKTTSGNTNAEMTIHVKCTDGSRYAVHYNNQTGSNAVSGSDGYIRLGGTSQEFMNKWVRLERDVQADVASLWSGKTISIITGTVPWCGNVGSNPYLWFDDLKLSNSVTVEHNVLGPGVIAHIMRHREVNATTFAGADEWFHYDQVGSVMVESGSVGTLAQTHHQDAFGNTQGSWSSGLIGGDQDGRHHNTQALDQASHLIYMNQRWYSASNGTFLAHAPYGPMEESSYSFVESNPIRYVDPAGRIKTNPWWIHPLVGPLVEGIDYFELCMCADLAEKLEHYRRLCERQLEYRTRVYERLGSANPEYEAMLWFIERWTNSGSYSAAMFSCTLNKAARYGEPDLLEDILGCIGDTAQFMPPNP